MTSYDINSFISPCCNAFIYSENDIIICTECEEIIKQLEGDEEMTIAIHYNIDKDKNTNISADLLNDQKKKSSRYANDITAELVNKPCPHCSIEGKQTNFTRHLRDLNGNNYFVCKYGHTFE